MPCGVFNLSNHKKWGDNSLLDEFNEKIYTHNYIALGDDYRRDSCVLTDLGETCGMPPEQVLPVCLNEVPIIKVDLVSSIGPLRDGTPKAIFLGLWSSAGGIGTEHLYRKKDWRMLDGLLFKKYRTERDKADLIRIIRRQWALALELPSYEESHWQSLLSLIQDHQQK